MRMAVFADMGARLLVVGQPLAEAAEGVQRELLKKTASTSRNGENVLCPSVSR
jgi:hypothetical protein